MTLDGCPTDIKAYNSHLERVRYFSHQLVTVEDMRAEQEYFREKMRRHNRFVHGWGVVCGLKVKAANSSSLRIDITSGYALGPHGDEIFLPETITLDFDDFGSQAPVSQCEKAFVGYAIPGGEIYVAIKYAECPMCPPAINCGCDETVCECSRIRDVYEIRCLPSTGNEAYGWNAEKAENIKSEDPWVVLAKVTLPKSGTNIDIKYSVGEARYRRMLMR